MRVRLPKLDILLQLGIILMVIKVSFNNSQILPYSELVDTVLAAMAAGLLGICILRQSFSKKILAGYLIIGALALYCVFKTGNYGFLITVILCMAMRSHDFDAVVKHIFVYETIFFVLHTCYSLTCWGFLGIPFWQDVYGVNRCSFGFIHPNMFSMYVFQLILMWVWLNYHKIKTEHVIGIAAISVYVVIFTKTRTSFIDTLILCFLLFFVREENRKLKKIVTLCAQSMIPVTAVIIIFLSVTYASGNPLSEIADKILNARIRLGGYAYEKYGMTLFGQDLSAMEVVWDPVWRITEHTFDNIYTALAINDGLVWLVIICIAFFKLAQKQNLKINICLIMWALYGVTEVHGLNAFMCFPILLVVLLYKEDEENIHERKQIAQRDFTNF